MHPFAIRRGTNISHWLSQSAKRGPDRAPVFTQTDVRQIAAWGFDHLRLPVDEEHLWTDAGTRDEHGWSLLASALDWCRDAGLKVIVDLHILRAHYFNDEAQPRLFSDPAAADQFGQFWEQLSDFLRHHPRDQVAYELMNEPVAYNNADWNRVAHIAYHAIRRREPDRVIVLGSNKWQICDTFPDLAVPPNDPNLTLSFHYYVPMPLTHYRASWWRDGKDYAGPVQYPGIPIPPDEFAKLPADMQSKIARFNTHCDASTMLASLAAPLAKSREFNLPLHCGEFGVLATAPAEPRHRWYRDLIATFESQNIAWSNWDYRGSFGIIDNDRRPTPVLASLLGSPK